MKLSILTLTLILLPAVGLAQTTLEQGYEAYESGEVATAIRIWRALGEAGNATAQVNLGQLYRLGKNLEKNDTEAVRWYSMAARQGSEVARYNLMLMHTEGRASRGDLDLAFATEFAAPNSATKSASADATQSDLRGSTTPSRARLVPAEAGQHSNWFEQLPAPLYVIQVVSSPNAQVLSRYAESRLPGSATQVLRTTRNNQDHNLLLIGPYNSRQQARRAITTLPESVQADKPWVRPVASVQQVAAPVAAGESSPADWFHSLPGPQYVLQLASSPYNESLRGYSERHLDQLVMQPQIVMTSRKSRDHYLLLLGPFASRAAARAMITDLPEQVQSKLPYARSVYSVQRVKKSAD